MSVAFPSPAPIGAVVRALAELGVGSEGTTNTILRVLGWRKAAAEVVLPRILPLTEPQRQKRPRLSLQEEQLPPDDRGALPSRMTVLAAAAAHAEEPAWLKGSTLLPLPDPTSSVALFEKPIEPLFSPAITRAILTRLAGSPAPAGEVDVRQLVDTVASGRPLTVLPRRPVLTLSKGLDLLIDNGRGMELFGNDMAGVVLDLALAVGRDRLTIRVFNDCPSEGVLDTDSATVLAYRPPPAGTPVLAVTDLGIGRRNSSAALIAEKNWLAFASEIRSRRSQFAVLTPYTRMRASPALRRAISLCTWDRRTGVRLTDPGRSDTARANGDGVTRLARLASIAGRIDPQLLRSLRLQLAPDLGTEAEADLWFSNHVQSAAITGAVLRPEDQGRFQDELAASGENLLQRSWEILFRLRTDRLWKERDRVPERSWLLAQEELTYWALKGIGERGPEREAAETRVRQILKTLLSASDSDREHDAVRWAKNAQLGLPRALLGLESMQHLIFGAAWRGATAVISEQIERTTRQSGSLSYLVPRGDRPTKGLWIRMVRGGLEVALDEISDAHKIETVALKPLPLTLSWIHGGVLDRQEVILNPPRQAFVGLNADQLEIATADGTDYICCSRVPF
jgi:hypothetical protein